MTVESISNGNLVTGLALATDEKTKPQPLSDVEPLVASAANGNSPLVRGEALRALDQATGDRTVSDRLAGGTVSPGQTTALQAPSSPAPLTLAQRTERLQAALPHALASIRTAAANPALTPEEAADLNAAAATLGRADTKFAYGAVPDQPLAGAAAATRNGRTTITINPHSPVLFRTDGSVDRAVLSAVLAHEGRHGYDARFYGERNGAKTLFEVRRTERNAYRTQAADLKATGGTMYTLDSTRTLVPLTTATANYAAEGSVKSWVRATALSAADTNRTIDANYATYRRQLAAYDRANGTHTTLQPRPPHVPVPTYSPPASY